MPSALRIAVIQPSAGFGPGESGRLAVRSVKAYYDAALGSRGARLLEDYSDLFVVVYEAAKDATELKNWLTAKHWNDRAAIRRAMEEIPLSWTPGEKTIPFIIEFGLARPLYRVVQRTLLSTWGARWNSFTVWLAHRILEVQVS